MDEIIRDTWAEPVTINGYGLNYQAGDRPMCRFQHIMAAENDGQFLRVFKSTALSAPATATIPIDRMMFWLALELDTYVAP